MTVRKIDGKLLKAWYKKHSKPGVQGKVKMLVVVCPKHGKVCAVDNVCLNEKKTRGEGIKYFERCDFWGGMEFGYIICNHPKAGGER